eukprot:TRINITY_DN3365_c1_g2_i2.p1 TRINITY_DN3365_c1_g2~~TRINITY_DN3365_c1_g2_i2.p1  ORF type:complete len:335 (+),score=70.62 TRINITY_DN3365_c1_g2_i2:92-1096(+)
MLDPLAAQPQPNYGGVADRPADLTPSTTTTTTDEQEDNNEASPVSPISSGSIRAQACDVSLPYDPDSPRGEGAEEGPASVSSSPSGSPAREGSVSVCLEVRSEGDDPVPDYYDSDPEDADHVARKKCPGYDRARRYIIFAIVVALLIGVGVPILFRPYMFTLQELAQRVQSAESALQTIGKTLTEALGAHQQLKTEVQQEIRTEELLREWSTRNQPAESGMSQRALGLPQAFVVNSPPRPDINGKYYLLPPRPDAKAAVWGGGPSGRGWIYMDTNNCWVVSAGSKSTNKAIGQYWTSDSPCSADSTSPDGLWWWYYDSVSQKWVFSDSISVTAA